MKVTDFDYNLPKHLIAQKPLNERSASRLLFLDKKNGGIEHKNFNQLLEHIKPGDCLVFNNTRVMPARIFGKKKQTGARVEFLLLKEMEADVWEVMVKPGKKAGVGTEFVFGEGLLRATVIDIVHEGNRRVRFSYEGSFYEILEKIGQMPLPPYIDEKLEEPERYQTVYAKQMGSAAAPTAGLHFTQDMLMALEKHGANLVYVTLHVGLGTFRPVKVTEVTNHFMHEEWFSISKEASEQINATKKSGGRVIAVGTTSVRVLESVANEDGFLNEQEGTTDIFIYPGYSFRCVDGLITNFHLPKSTLLMLVSALAGKESVMKAYDEAVKNEYRFFSFGDAMFIG